VGQDGKPLTDKIQIMSVAQWARWPAPFLWVHEDSSFTVFMVDSLGTLDRDIEPIPAARRYDSAGRPITALHDAEEAKSLEGYQDVIERLAVDAMESLEYSLREYLTKDVMGFRFCQDTSPSWANRMKKLSRDTRKREFFASLCKERLAHCGRPQTRPEEQDQCLAPDDGTSSKSDK
ncbi:MAG: hypothetical protein ACREI3_10435, partial [Nitrospirales bacterium]